MPKEKDATAIYISSLWYSICNDFSLDTFLALWYTCYSCAGKNHPSLASMLRLSSKNEMSKITLLTKRIWREPRYICYNNMLVEQVQN